VYPQPKEGNTTKQKKNNSYNKMKARTHSNKSFYFPTIKISADDVEKISKKKKLNVYNQHNTRSSLVLG
jgi:hypothetical protein